MYFERLLASITGVVVAVCLGVGLTFMAIGPARQATDIAATPPPASEPRAEEAPQTPEPSQPPPAAAADPRAKVEAAIAGTAEYAGFFQRMRESFPAEYESAIEDFAREAAGSKKVATADYYLSDSVRRLRQARGAAASKAEAAPLARVFKMQLEVLRAVASEDKKTCVAFLYGATSLDFERFANGRRPLLGDMALAGLEAIASGEAKKVERGAPTEADFAALEKALAAKGLGKAEIDALLDGKQPDPPIDDAKMCAAGQVYFEVLANLPEAPRSRIYGLAVELMSRS